MKLQLTATLVLGLMLSPVTLVAQDSQTLADVRQELTILYTEVQKLRRELSTSGTGGVNTGGNS
ncbi:MAG: tol-pal system protein, partial [Sulfitobacter geojensis]